MYRIALRNGWLLEITPVDDSTVECTVLQPVGDEGQYHAVFTDTRPAIPAVVPHKEWAEQMMDNEWGMVRTRK